ncbi:neuronal acetylcholine receptor subunit alpha-7-like [Saccostrea echinata]|uniref:neuronal acetylcholine receptor subunit alpha-7-like n=1 Tax=Saccostrea echinata TaxID=191078 RepID=UPI002A807028|nr:neuronal acetylcholine receptor subunit alpha-7-like [Saccostrea echinata]
MEFYKSLKTDPLSHIRPVKNQSLPITVLMDLILHSVVSYDEKTGTLLSLIIANMTWTDELVREYFSKEVVDEVPIPMSLIWSPGFSIYNTVTEDTTLKTSDNQYQTVISSPDGTMRNLILGLSTTKCDADMFYYPMDVQTCKIHFVSDEPLNKVVIQPTSDAYLGRLTALHKNEEWEITHVMCETDMISTYSKMIISFKMTRKPMYLFMNFVVPLMYLCSLNLFLLPESSGERVSYAVTMLLALILYLNMIADRLPNTVPVSLININIAIQLNTSCFVVLMTILTLRMHEKSQKDQPVPWFWQVFVSITSTNCLRKSRSKVHTIAVKEAEVKEEKEEENDDEGVQGSPDNKPTVSWIDVSRSANKFLFWMFFSLLSIQSVVFFVLIMCRPM